MAKAEMRVTLDFGLAETAAKLRAAADDLDPQDEPARLAWGLARDEWYAVESALAAVVDRPPTMATPNRPYAAALYKVRDLLRIFGEAAP